MNCKKIKELIITDYIDSQLNERLKKQIDEHLSVCSQCRELEESLRKVAVEPFKNLKETRPSDYVWWRIKESIEAEQSQQRERVFFHIPRPIFATITAVAALVIIATITIAVLNQEMQINSFFQEQEEFLSSLGAANSSTAGNTSFGTALEELFL